MATGAPWSEGWFTGWMPEGLRQTLSELPGMASWQKMGAPPGAAMLAFVGAVQDRLAGRKVSVGWGGSEVTGTLASFAADPGPFGVMAGQFDSIRLAARDLEWQGRRLGELTVSCRNIHLRPGRVPLLVAAPVEIVATVGADELDSWLVQVPDKYRLSLNDEGIACACLRRFPKAGHLEFEPQVHGQSLLLAPRRYVLRGRGVPVPLAGLALSLAPFPEGLLIRRIDTVPGQVRVELLLTEFRQRLSPGLLERLADLVRRGADRLEIPQSGS